MARSFIFFRVVYSELEDLSVETPQVEMAPHGSTQEGGLGVRTLLYFDFSFEGPNVGTLMHPPGYAHVRAHADPGMANNPTYVFTWRKDLLSQMCQTCSDLAVSATFFLIVDSRFLYLHYVNVRFAQLVLRNLGAPKSCVRKRMREYSLLPVS
jgi:hypothetical protein